MPNQPTAMQRMPSTLETARRSPTPLSPSKVSGPAGAPSPMSPMSPLSPMSPFDMPIAVLPAPGMRRWLKSLLTGLGSSRGRIANIQHAMLAELSQVAIVPLHEEKLARMIVQAREAEALWQLRHLLADAICAVHGELVAHQKMTEISFMFAGLLRRRPGPDTPGADNVVHLASRGQQPGVNP